MHGAFDVAKGKYPDRPVGVRRREGKYQIYFPQAGVVIAEGSTWDEAVGKLLALK